MDITHVTRAASTVLLHDGYHNPTLIIECEDHLVLAALEDIAATHQDRLIQMRTVADTIRREEQPGPLVQLFFVCEAWMSTHQDEAPRVPPSEDPDRKEVLVITHYRHAEKTLAVATLEMIRDEDGTLREIAPITPPEGRASAGSPLIDAFVEALTHEGELPQ